MEYNLLILPTESLSHIISYCDLYSANNLLQSCKTIHHAYKTYTGTIIEKSCQKIFFGIDRVIHDNPKICASLSNTAHLKGLMNYAQKYYCPHTNKIIL